MNGSGLFIWLSFVTTIIACSILYFKTRKTLKKYEKEFANEINKLSQVEKEAILKNNSPCKKNVKVTTGDIIHIEFLPLAEVKLKAENISLDILYEDSYLIICNKPTKMVTHPAP